MADSKAADTMDAELIQAKAFLSQKLNENEPSLYDHFTTVLTKLLDERPQNSADLIENYFEESKRQGQKLEDETKPQQPMEKPQELAKKLQESAEKPQEAAEKPQESAEKPQDSAEKPQEVAEKPQESAEKLQESTEKPQEETLAQHQMKLFDSEADGDNPDAPPNENEEESDIPLPNVMELAFSFEQAGTGLAREEIYRIFLALKQLVFSYPLVSVRFWGKIFGIHANYIIAEVEFREGEDAEKEAGEIVEDILEICFRCGSTLASSFQNVLDEEEEEKEDEKREEESEDGEGSEDDEIPKPQWVPPPVIPKEENHTGANKKVYFVCNEAGQPWVRLPHVTPAQIVVARQIRKFFTGKLDTQIVSYPQFNGTEANYLRAQIARISAGTHISPAGYYTFEEGDEDEDEGLARDSYEVDLEFKGLSVKDMIESSMQGWVHHVQSILPQGRCTWFDPFQKPEDDFEDEDLDEDEEEKLDVAEPETGPPLLSSAADDEPLSKIPAWTTYVSSKSLPEYSIAVARSNRWPGAFAFAKGKTFENLYIGYGHKYQPENYSPPMPPAALEEFPSGPDVMEMDDPTVEDEQALKKAQEEAMKAAEEMDGMDDDEDDDD